MAKVYILFYDHDGSGAREEWNTFYTPCEAFASAMDRDLRKTNLTAADPDLSFHELDLDMPDTVAAINGMPGPGDDAPEKELTQEEIDALLKKANRPNFIGAPENLDDAIDRIVEVELRLGDLHRAAEIAVAVRDFTLIEGQMPEAEACLEKKIVLEYPQGDGPNIVVYS